MGLETCLQGSLPRPGGLGVQCLSWSICLKAGGTATKSDTHPLGPTSRIRSNERNDQQSADSPRYRQPLLLQLLTSMVLFDLRKPASRELTESETKKPPPRPWKRRWGHSNPRSGGGVEGSINNCRKRRAEPVTSGF